MRIQNFLIRRLKPNVLIFAVTALTMPFSAGAQDIRITLPNSVLSAEQVFDHINRQTSYKITANKSRMAEGLSVKIERSPVAVSEVLNRLFAGTGYTYSMDGNMIILPVTVEEAAVSVKSGAAARTDNTVAATVKSGVGGSTLKNETSGALEIEEEKSITNPLEGLTADGDTSGNSVAKQTSAELTLNQHDSFPDLNASPQPAQVVDSVNQPENVPVMSNGEARTLAAVAVPSEEQYSHREPARVDAARQKSIPTVGLKTNLLYDATATINLGLEFRLGDRTSLDVPVNWNPFMFRDNRKWKHIFVQPELRLWTRETFAGHFIGMHAHYAFYNVGNLPKPFSQYMRDHRFQGWLAGVGVSYGYRWNFGKDKDASRWGMEATVGVGYAYLDYNKFACERCGKSFGNETKHYFGPTKVGLSLVYNIGRKKQPEPAPVDVPVYIPPVIVEPEPEPELQPEPEPEPIVILPYAPQFAVSYIVPEAEAVKVRSEAGSAYLDFAAGKAEIVPDFKNNAAELDKIYAMIRNVRDNSDAIITGISITGYASPEGSYATNLSLSERRAASLKDQLKMVTGYADSFFTVEGKGEDWATLDSLVARSGMADKYAILGIIRGTDIFDGRERRLMSLSGGNPYRAMKADLFPRLRRTEYQLHYMVVPFTLEKGKEVFESRPSSLSLNEMYLIANSYEAGSDRFNEVIETAARMFPQDDAANLNAAASALDRGDVVQAEKYLSKVKSQTAAYHNNMGVLHGLRSEWDKAIRAFARAGARENAGEVERKLENIEAISRNADGETMNELTDTLHERHSRNAD